MQIISFLHIEEWMQVSTIGRCFIERGWPVEVSLRLINQHLIEQRPAGGPDRSCRAGSVCIFPLSIGIHRYIVGGSRDIRYFTSGVLTGTGDGSLPFGLCKELTYATARTPTVVTIVLFGR